TRGSSPYEHRDSPFAGRVSLVVSRGRFGLSGPYAERPAPGMYGRSGNRSPFGAGILQFRSEHTADLRAASARTVTLWLPAAVGRGAQSSATGVGPSPGASSPDTTRARDQGRRQSSLRQSA